MPGIGKGLSPALKGSLLNCLKSTTKAKFLFLWTGKFDGDNLLSDLDSSVITVTNKDFATNYIPAISTATFAIPDNATYKTADEDLLWANSGGVVLEKTTSQLVEFDYTRTLIKYSNNSPYNIQAIGILKTGEALNATEIDEVHKYFKLWLYWSGVLNANGYIKGNRDITTKPIQVSAEIPQTQLDKVVITFDQNLNESIIPATTAFTLAGKTITNVAISTNKVTLTVSVNYAFSDSGITVSYTQPVSNPLRSNIGGVRADSFASLAVTNNILPAYSADTVGWYDFAVGITKTGSLITNWADKLGSGRDLKQADTNKSPSLEATGVLFGGVDEFMKTDAFTYNQPATVYLVLNQKSWTSLEAVFSGTGTTAAYLYQDNGASNPQFALHSGASLAGNAGTELALNTYGIVIITVNGVNSEIRVNNLTPKTGNAGTNNLAAIWLGCRGSGSGDRFSNVEYKEVICRKVADDAPTKTIIYNYLKAKYSL